MGTPVINQPQVAIMAVGAIKKRLVVIETAQGRQHYDPPHDVYLVNYSVGVIFMRVFNPILIIVTLLSLTSCKSKQHSFVSNHPPKLDTSLNNNAPAYSQDSLGMLRIPKFETSSTIMPPFPDNPDLSKKRRKILDNFLVEFSPSGDEYDTLVDVNYDRFKDYVIGYYGLAGTGYKYRMAVYLYSKSRKDYVFNKQLSGIVNPSFYLSEFKITGFYIGLGGGDGEKLEWIKNKWQITKTFYVSNEGDSTVWEITYPLLNKKEKINRHFQVIPPQEILETNPDF